MILRKIDKSKYKEYMEYAEECTANRVYPVSIANGIQDGEIYTDDKGCVLFRHYCGFAYLSGNVNPEVLDEIYQEFLAVEMDRKFLLITDSKDISDFYSRCKLIQLDKRIEYVHSGILENMPELDERFVYERITAENIGDIQGRIIPSFSWRNSDAFLQNGFGFLLRNWENGCFAAVAFSSAISPEEVDIGVETVASYRHNGLASNLSYRMCEEIVNQGKKPVWAHAESNIGSQKTAIRAGFKPCKVNTVIRKKR
jgi:hypothetical protein